MPNDLEAILEETELVPASAERLLEAFVPEWTKRCEGLLIKGEREFCFVWRAKEDGLRGPGMLCRRDMVREYFGDDMGEAIEQLIDKADHVTQVVGILIFGEKGYGFTVHKAGDLEMIGPQILN